MEESLKSAQYEEEKRGTNDNANKEEAKND